MRAEMRRTLVTVHLPLDAVCVAGIMRLVAEAYPSARLETAGSLVRIMGDDPVSREHNHDFPGNWTTGCPACAFRRAALDAEIDERVSIREAWRALGFGSEAPSALAWAGISPEAARSMTDAALKHVRGIGPVTLREIRRVLDVPEDEA